VVHDPEYMVDISPYIHKFRFAVKNSGANLAIIRRLALNYFHMDTSKSKKGQIRRVLAAEKSVAH
jgi:hypothetical protein